MLSILSSAFTVVQVGFSRLHPSLADELTSFHLSSSILCSAVSAYLHACGVRSQGRMKRSRFVAICNRVIHIDEKERRNLESNPPRWSFHASVHNISVLGKGKKRGGWGFLPSTAILFVVLFLSIRFPMLSHLLILFRFLYL